LDQHEPQVRRIERTVGGEDGGVQHVDITVDHLNIAQALPGDNRACGLDSLGTAVETHDRALRAGNLGEFKERAHGAAADIHHARPRPHVSAGAHLPHRRRISPDNVNEPRVLRLARRQHVGSC
jgi:hypothetical protein